MSIILITILFAKASHVSSDDNGKYVTLTRYVGNNCTETPVVLSGAPTMQCIPVYDSHDNYTTIASTILDCNSTHITTHIYNDERCADFNTSFIKGFAEECYDNNKEHYPVRFSHELGNINTSYIIYVLSHSCHSSPLMTLC